LPNQIFKVYVIPVCKNAYAIIFGRDHIYHCPETAIESCVIDDTGSSGIFTHKPSEAIPEIF